MNSSYLGSQSCGFLYSVYTPNRNENLYLLNENGTSNSLDDFSTAYNDINPFIAPDGKLYFSSDIKWYL